MFCHDIYQIKLDVTQVMIILKMVIILILQIQFMVAMVMMKYVAVEGMILYMEKLAMTF